MRGLRGPWSAGFPRWSLVASGQATFVAAAVIAAGSVPRGTNQDYPRDARTASMTRNGARSLSYNVIRAVLRSENGISAPEKETCMARDLAAAKPQYAPHPGPLPQPSATVG